MKTARMASHEKVVLLGADNSPWGQTALLAIHLKGLKYSTTILFSPRRILRHGFASPAIYHGSLEISGSDNILRYLHSLGDVSGQKCGSLVDAYVSGTPRSTVAA